MSAPDVSHFNAFDWLLTGIVLLSTVAAFFKGIIKVLLSLGGLILGIIIAAWNYQSVTTRLSAFVPNAAIARIAAFLLILTIVMVVFSLLAKVLRRAVSAVGLGIFDRLLGAAFGFARGLLAGAALMMAILAFFPSADTIKNSHLAPYFLAGAHAVSLVVPQQFQKQFAQGATHLLQQSPELFRPNTLIQSPQH